jgi:hypothetical protein
MPEVKEICNCIFWSVFWYSFFKNLSQVRETAKKVLKGFMEDGQ